MDWFDRFVQWLWSLPRVSGGTERKRLRDRWHEVRADRKKRSFQARRWRLRHRAEWIAAWGILATIFSGATVAMWIAHLTRPHTVPWWPALTLLLLAVAFVLLVLSPVMHFWPFRRPRDTDAIVTMLSIRVAGLSGALSLFDVTSKQLFACPPAQKAAYESNVDEAARSLNRHLDGVHTTVRERLGWPEEQALWGRSMEPIDDYPKWLRPGDAILWRRSRGTIGWMKDRIARLQDNSE